MDAVTEALNHMLKLQDEDQALEEAIEAECAEILKSREQTVEAMRAWVDQLDPDEALQKLAEFMAPWYVGSAPVERWPEWYPEAIRAKSKWIVGNGMTAITIAAQDNILRRRELAEQDGVREPIE